MSRLRALFTRSLSAAALAVVVTVAAVPLFTGSAFAGTTTASPPPCPGIVHITRMAFQPATVFPGQSSTVHLAAVNCTDRAIDGSVTWLGRWIGPTTGLPPGCPAIDPLPGAANFAPHGLFVGHVTYLVPSGCSAVGLQVTATISSGAAVLARHSATLRIARPPA